MTSCHDVTKPNLLSQLCARKLILFLFLWFFRSLSSNLLLIFYFCDHVTSWRHVMTSQNLIYLSQLVDVLGSWFFFCFYSFLGHWVQICNWFFIFVIRDVMTSCHDVTKPNLPISACRCARKLTFFVSMVFMSLSSEIWIIFNFVHVIASWRHVTSRQYLSSPYILVYRTTWQPGLSNRHLLPEEIEAILSC